MKKSMLALTICAICVANVAEADETLVTVTGSNGDLTIIGDTTGGNTALPGGYNLDNMLTQQDHTQTAVTNLQDEVTKGLLATHDGLKIVSDELTAHQNALAQEAQSRLDSDRQLYADINATKNEAKADNAATNVELAKIAGVNDSQDQVLGEHETRIKDLENAPKPKDGVNGKDGAAGKDADMTKVDANTKGVADNAQSIVTLQSGIAQKVDNGDYQQHIAAVQKSQKATNDTLATHTRELANHENRITALESENNANFGKLKNEVDDNRKRASAGIAGVAAMANIPQVLQSQSFSVGAGAGTTDGESAVAVGFSARATENTVVKATVSTDTQHNFVAGAGVAYGW